MDSEWERVTAFNFVFFFKKYFFDFCERISITQFSILLEMNFIILIENPDVCFIVGGGAGGQKESGQQCKKQH